MCGSQNHDFLRAARVFGGAALGAMANFLFVFMAEKFLPGNRRNDTFRAWLWVRGHILKRGDPMEDVQRQVLQALLKTLYDQGLMAKATYDGAVNMVNSQIDLPEFFWYPVCCSKEEIANGSS